MKKVLWFYFVFAFIFVMSFFMFNNVKIKAGSVEYIDESVYSQGLKYGSITETTCYVTGKGTCTDSIIRIPSQYNGLTVIGIDEEAFRGLNATTVIIPPTVQKISSLAFLLAKLNYLVIPSSVTTMGEQVFSFDSFTLYCQAASIPSGWNSMWKNNFTGSLILNCANKTHTCKNELYISTVKSTCIEAGYQKYQCVICNAECKKNETSFAEHTEVITPAKEATCANTGLTEGKKCSVCDETIVPQNETPIVDHSYTEVVTEPTCTERGYTTYICDVCGYTYKDNYVEATNHIYENKLCIVCNQKQPSEGLEYTLLEDGTYEVTGIGTCRDTNVIIPSKYNGIDVTSIGEEAFLYNDFSITVDIPDSIITIKDFAFCGINSLEKITIPDSVVSLGHGMFYGCNSLMEITIPYVGLKADGTENSTFGVLFGESSYVPESLKTVKITNATKIANYAFDNCKYIENISIPNSVEKIGAYVFENCNSLKNIYYDGNIEDWIAINNNVWFSNPKNYNFGIYMKDSEKNWREETVLEVPNTIDTIGEYAFSNFISLKSITIPDSVTKIGKGIIKNCYSLESITIPFIGESKDTTTNNFLGYFFGATSHTNNKNYVHKELKTVELIGEAKIGDYAFYECSSLTNIILNTSTPIDSIGKYAFYKCSALKNITIPESVSEIGDNAFYECSTLVSIKIPDLVTEINDYTFYMCTSLKEIELSLNLKRLGYNSFSGCSSLESIIIPEQVTIIEGYAFNYCSSLTMVIIPDAVISIEQFAFYNCSSLKEVKLSNNLTSISTYSFYNCSSLKTIEIPSSVKKIDMNAFYNCSSLETIEIPSSVEKVDTYAFYKCELLTNVYYKGTINDWLKIDFQNDRANPMYYASNLFLYNNQNEFYNPIDIVISSEIEEITQYSLMNVNSLIKVSFEENSQLSKIGSGAFKGCNNLIVVDLPENVTSIGANAFANCDNLRTIIISKKVTTMEFNVFSYCSNLKIYCEAESQPSEWSTQWNPSKCFVQWGYTRDTSHNCVGDILSSSVESTCEKIGFDIYVCSICNKEYYENIVKELGHNIVTYEGKNPTCQEKGYKPYEECSRCDYTTYEELDIVDHNVVDNTCTMCSNIYDDNGLLYRLLDDGTYEVAGIGFCTDLYITIPSQIKGKDITSIGEKAFYNCNKLYSITLPSTIKNIGNEAFYNCSKISSMNLQNGITYIGDRAFYRCSQISNINLSYGITYIGAGAFYECRALESITIPNSITNINAATFYLCTSLTNVTLPNNLQSIGESAFDSCFELQSITFPNTLQSLGNSSFSDCETLSNISIPNSVTSIGSDIFNGCSNLQFVTLPNNMTVIPWGMFSSCGSLETINLPSTITEIEGYAFSSCSSMNQIILPNGLKSIGEYAFQYCTNLTSIIIPSNVKILDNNVFYSCSNLTNITLSNKLNHIGDMTFGNCSSLVSIEIPSSVTSIGFGTFVSCQNLKSIVIPNSVTSMGESIFMMCTNLKNVTLSNNLTSIPVRTFSDCESLEIITLPSNIESINEYAFYDCTSLKQIEIPTNVKTIGNDVFNGASALEYITIPNNVNNIGSRAFYNCSKLTIYCEVESQPKTWNSSWNISNRPVFWNYKNSTTHTCLANLYVKTVSPTCIEEGYDLYKCVVCEKEYYTNIVKELGHNLVTYEGKNPTCQEKGYKQYEECSICDYTTYEELDIVDHNIINGICNMCEFKFYSGGLEYKLLDDDTYELIGIGTCTDVDLIIPSEYEGKKVTSIGTNVFYQCYDLESITIPESIKVFKDHRYIAHYNKVYYKGTIEDWCNITFTTANSNPMTYASEFYLLDTNDEWYLVTEIVIPDTIETIGNYQFKGFTNLISITMSNNVTVIKGMAFYECSSLEEITLSNNLKIIEDSAFNECRSLEKIELPNTIVSIDRAVFAHCSSLKEIKLPSGISKLAESLFFDCTSLEKVIIPQSVKTIEYDVFTDCISLKELMIPSSVSTIGNYSIRNCTSLKTIVLLKSIESIGENTFINCTNLTIYCEASSQPSGWNKLWNPSNCKVIWGCNDIQITEGLEYTLLEDGTYEVSGVGTFTGNDIFIPLIYDNRIVSGIADEAFKNNDIKNVVIADGIINIGDNAFNNCSNLNRVIIPSSIENMGNEAFKNCENLTIYLENNNVPDAWGDNWKDVSNEIVTDCENDVDHNCFGTEYLYTIDPTCIGGGCDVFKCIVCHKECFSKFTSALGHDTQNHEGKDATCMESGYKPYQTCSRCDFTTYEEIPALGHSYEKRVIEPTCTEKGYTEFLCKCGDSYIYEYVDEKGHIEVIDEAKEATCTETGLTEGKHCSVCNEVLIAQTTIEVKPHIYGDWVVVLDPTYKDEGIKEKKCIKCEFAIQELIAKLEYPTGDLDCNVEVNTDDVIYLLMNTYFPDQYPIEQECDYNEDSNVNTDDVIYLLMYLYFPDQYPIEDKEEIEETNLILNVFDYKISESNEKIENYEYNNVNYISNDSIYNQRTLLQKQTKTNRKKYNQYI